MDKIQVIFYAPYTNPAIRENEKSMGIPGGDNPNARVYQVGNMIMEAARFASTDNTVLKIFLAPEWVFRHAQGKPYRDGEMYEVIEKLRQISQSPLLANMLIIPGSILWEMPDNPSGAALVPKKKTPKIGNWRDIANVQIYNTLPVLRNGQLVHIYHKQHNAGDATNNVKEYMPMGVNENQAFLSWQQNPNAPFALGDKAESGIFTHDGINFGIEICRDHGEATLLREYVAKNPNGNGLDVHIVVACGIYSLSKQYLASRFGGYAFLCEGDRIDPNRNLASQEATKVTRRTGTVKSSASTYNSASNVTIEIQKVQDAEKRTYGTTLGSRLIVVDRVLSLR